MEDPGIYLLMIGGLFLLGAVGEVIFKRTQIPDVVWLILAGVILRALGLVDPVKLDAILPLFAALTLIIVLFDGGRQIVITELIKVAPKAGALGFLTFFMATLGVAVVLQLAALTGLLPDTWTFSHSIMVGAMVGGSSSLVIMPSMALAKVDGKVSNLVGLESSLTDALCVVFTVVMINIIASGESSGASIASELAINFGVALLVGAIAGWTWFPVLRGLSGNQYAYPVTLAALFVLYVIVDRLNGNPAMAVLTFSIIVGNAESLMKMVNFSLGDQPLKLDSTVVTVHTQAAFIIKSFFFTYIGLMLQPPFSLLLLGIVVGLVLFATRIPAVMLIARKPEFNDNERKMIGISLPRGMAAGVLATLPAAANIAGTSELPSMVFAAVVTSIVIFAVGFRKVRAESVAMAPNLDAVSERPDALGSGEAPAAVVAALPSMPDQPVTPTSQPAAPIAQPAPPTPALPVVQPVAQPLAPVLAPVGEAPPTAPSVPASWSPTTSAAPEPSPAPSPAESQTSTQLGMRAVPPGPAPAAPAEPTPPKSNPTLHSWQPPVPEDD